MSKVSNEVALGLEGELESLWRFALRLTSNEDDAADLVQRTCVRALEQCGSYDARGKLRSWLFRIEHRIWLNEIRARKIRSQGAFQPLNGGSHEQLDSNAVANPPGASSPEGNAMLHEVYNAVESLSENQRTVMILVCVEGFSYSEVALILDVPIGTIMSRLSRGRIAIGKRMLSTGTQKSLSVSTIEYGGEYGGVQ